MATNLIAKKWFKDWSNEYDRTLGKVPRHLSLLDKVVDVSGVKDGDNVLDIGCGTGLLSLKFLEKADCVITAMDNSPQMMAVFQEKVKKHGLENAVSFKLVDAISMTFKANSFDIVASTVTLHHVKNKLPVIKKIRTILKPGGKFVLGEINVDCGGDVTDIIRMKRILAYLNAEFIYSMEGGGVVAFNRMYDNGKKHILRDGEFCINLNQWKAICLESGFKKVSVYPLPGFKWFRVLKAIK